MVYTRIIVVSILALSQVTADLHYKGATQDGGVTEVHSSQTNIPGGGQSVTTFSSKVGGLGGLGGGLSSRMFGFGGTVGGGGLGGLPTPPLSPFGGIPLMPQMPFGFGGQARLPNLFGSLLPQPFGNPFGASLGGLGGSSAFGAASGLGGVRAFREAQDDWSASPYQNPLLAERSMAFPTAQQPEEEGSVQ